MPYLGSFIILLNTFVPYFIISAFYVFINDLTAHKKDMASKTKYGDVGFRA
jgi:hypothetical protein